MGLTMNLPPAALMHRALFILLAVTGAGILLLAIYVAALFPGLPSIEKLREARVSRPSVLLALDGTPIASFSQKQQEHVALKDVSPNVLAALLTTEDHRFYKHHGVDISRTVSAVRHTLKGNTQGGSTITQQLARNLFPEEIGRQRSVNRKVREIITALRIERAYTKDEILETYLNTVPFLYNVVGIEMAARTYYDKSAADLDVLESATLIGMLKGTSYYNPVINPERAQKRRNVVLGQMVKYKALPEADFDNLKEKPLNVHFNKQADPAGVAPHFAAQARKWLIEWADQNDFNLYTDGLVVQSTIDLHLQQAANSAVERQAQALQTIFDVEWGQGSGQMLSSSTAAYTAMHRKVEPFRYFWSSHPELLDAFVRETPEYRQAIAAGAVPAAASQQVKQDAKAMAALRLAKTQLEAGFVAIDPHSGEVRAWVGSRNFVDDQYDHVIQAERQPGSTFKPFVYGAALERGIQPDHVYYDKPVELRFTDGTVWRPTDMTGPSGEPMSLRQGLIYSKNTITAQVMQDVGIPSIVGLAQAMGVNQSKLDPVPSLALGTSPVTLMEMASSYATIANQGEYHKPVFIKSIADRDGRVLARFGNDPPTRAMSQNTALELIDMMRGVVNRGTGTAVKTRFGIVADIAGKTGTTQNNTDGWFILMHPDLVAGAWVGFNDARVTMRSNYWGQGGHNAILIVGDFFRGSMNSKIIDAKATFPQAPSATMMARLNLPEQDWATDTGGVVTEVPPSNAAPAIITIRGDANGVVIENARETGSSVPRAEKGAPKDAQEIEKILSGMGRDPTTGAVVVPVAARKPEARSSGPQAE
ncbi:MAG: penicillin-binding protein [Rhodocyclales bacterium]|nr:penicillin-binding protein [Rhodocyclales bacterium]